MSQTNLEGAGDNKEIIQKQLDDGENGVVGTEHSLSTSKLPVSPLIKKAYLLEVSDPKYRIYGRLQWRKYFR